MTQYLSVDVLLRRPNFSDDPSDTIDHAQSVLDGGMGKVTAYDKGPYASGAHSFNWFIQNKADADDLRTFFNTRRGMAVPFWIPTWRQDLPLASSIASSVTSMSILLSDYTLFMFPDVARRTICIFMSDGSTIFRQITGTIDNGDGTETLTLDSAPGVNVPQDTMVSYLLFCRLDTDELEIGWLSSTVGSADLPYVELPLEVPTV